MRAKGQMHIRKCVGGRRPSRYAPCGRHARETIFQYLQSKSPGPSSNIFPILAGIGSNTQYQSLERSKTILCGVLIRSGPFPRETQRITHDSLLTMPYGAKLPNQPQSAVRLQGSLSTNLDSTFCGQITECLSCYPNAVLSPGTHE